MDGKWMGKLAMAVVLLLAAGMVSAATAEYGTLAEINSTSFLPQSIHPGDTISMAVAIKNRGSSISMADLNASIELDNQFTPVSVSGGIDGIKPGAVKSLVFKFMASQSITPGYYQVFINLEYTRDGRRVTERFGIPVPVTATQRNLDVRINPRAINPGHQTDMVFTVKNTSGTPISNILFAWSEKSNLVLPLGTDNRRFIDSVGGGESREINYAIAADPNITPGIYPLDITINFTDSNGTRTQTSQVGLIVGGGTDFEVSAEINQNNQLSVSIANVGSNNAGALVVKIPQPNAVTVSGSNASIIGNLNKGDFSLANFALRQGGGFDANSVAGAGLRQRSAGTAGAGQTPQGSDSGQAIGGGQNTAGQQAWTGTQQGGRQNGAGFAAAARANDLMVQISYTDTTGERITIEKIVRLNSTTAPTGATGFAGRQGAGGDAYGTIALVLLALFIAAGVGYNHFKAKMEWKKIGIRLTIAVVAFGAAMLFLNSSMISVAAAAIISVAVLGEAFIGKQAKK